MNVSPKIEIKSLRLQGLLEHRPQLGPQTVHFDIANACNVRCTTCWHHSHLLNIDRVPTPEWKRKSVPFERFRKIFDDLIELGGLEQIILSGMGDPSMNDELIDMVQYAHRFGIGVTIITNLLRVDLPRLLQDRRPIEAGLLDLLVSVCGVTPDVWNAFHAMPSGFEKLLKQLDILTRAEFQPKHVQVINAQNFHQLPEMVRFANAWPAKRINFKFASLAHGTEVCGLMIEQKQELFEVLIPRAKAVAAFHEIETDLDAFASQVACEGFRTAPIESVGCFMGTVYCRITVDLELLYCCNTEVSVGFLDEANDFRSLWLSRRYNDWRDQLSRGDFLESCKQCGKYKQNLRWAEKMRRITSGVITPAQDRDHLDDGELDT